MGMADFIVKHAKIVIAVWLIAIVVMAPLALQLNSVLSYEETAFLPENTESSIADKILQEEFNASAMGMNNTILIITGIDVNDPSSREAYTEFKKQVEGVYAENLLSIYDIYDELNNTANNISEIIVLMISNSTSNLKNYTILLASQYDETINNMVAMKKFIDIIRENLVNTSHQYQLLKENITGFYMLINGVRMTLLQLDQQYMYTKGNLSMMYQLVTGLNMSITHLNNATYGISMGYDKLFYDMSRTFYYLSQATDAYQTGSIDENDTAIVLYYTNMSSLGSVDPQLIYLVYYSTYPLIGNNTELVNDYTIANMTYLLMNQSITMMYRDNESMLRTATALLEAYHNSFINTLQQYETNNSRLIIDSYTLNTTIAGQVQDQVYMYINSIGREAVNGVKTVLASIIEEYFNQYSYPITSSVADYIASIIIEIGPVPTHDKIINAVYNATLAVINSTGMYIPGVENMVYQLVTRGYSIELVKEIFINSTLMMTKQMPEQQKMLVLRTVYLVPEIDPNATGILLYNSTLLKNYTLETIYSIINISMIPIPGFKDLVGELYELPSLNDTILENISRKIMIETAKQYMSNISIEMPAIPRIEFNESMMEEFLEVVIDYAMKINYSNPVEVYNATYNIISELAGKEPIMTKILDKVFNDLYYLNTTSIDSIRRVVDPLFINMTMEMIKEYLPSNAPSEVYEFINETIEWIIDKYPVNNESIREYVTGKVLDMINEYASEEPMFKDLLDRLNLGEIVSEAYNGISSDELVDRVKPVVFTYFLDHMKPYIETLKSSDNTTMIVMFNPLGSSSEEEYENALKVKQEALNAYHKSFSSCEAYVTGGDVSSEELKRVGRRDVSRVQQFSYIFTLIMLFIVVEAVFAVLVPFVSIGSAIMFASGIVYLLASNVMTISNWATVLMTTTSLGLGIDYTTYFLHRLREMIGKGMEFEEAVAEAIRKARDGIIASASTDIIGFAVLMIAWDFPFLRVIGVVVPIAIFSVFLASLTLIPAIVSILARRKWFWWPRIPKKLTGDKLYQRSRLVDVIIKYRGLVIALFLILSIPATYTYLTFQGSHDIQLYLPEGTETANAYHLLQEKIGAAITSSTYVVIKLDKPLSDDTLPLIEEISSRIASMKHVKLVYSPTRPFGEPLENLSMKYVEAFNGTTYLSKDNKTVLIRIVLDIPAESDEARSFVKDLRNMLHGYADKYSIITGVYVGGIAAAFVDLDELLETNFWHRIIPVSIILMFIALTLSLRGVLASLITLGIIYVGTTWSIWLSSILFHGLFGKPLLWFLPLVLLVVLLGVGVDYNSFYLVKVRDEMETHDPRKALSIAARHSGKLIIGLALILVSAYISLMLTSMWAMREMGFVLTAGVLLIAVSAVYVLSPAIISYLGYRVWWPFRRKKTRGEEK